MANPPAIVLTVFEAVCILMGCQKTDWSAAKSLLLDLNAFVKSLINYDKDNIPESRIKKLNKVLARPEFDVEIIRSKVSYAGDIAGFCRAMKIYNEVNEKVAPKKEMVARLM